MSEPRGPRERREAGQPGGRGNLPPKLYFRIGEVAGLVGVEPHVLRYWEREFRTIRPTKSAKGQRVYSRRDVENLLRVRDLLYAEGFTIAGAKKRLLAGTDATMRSGLERVRNPPSKLEEEETAELRAPEEASAQTAHLPSPSDPDAQSEPQRPLQAASSTTTSARVREKLVALRAEVEAFLQELGG
jgi:DNA-binding transcriptional MerR regulator